MANSDKSNLSAALDEAGDRILLLEGLIGERDSKLAELLEEISELRDSSSWLSNELESMICLNERLAQLEGHQKEHLNEGSELNQSQQTKRSQLIESLRQLRLKSRVRQRASERLMERRRELAAAVATAVNGSAVRSSSANGRRAKSKRKRDAASSSLFDEVDDAAAAGDDDDDDDEIELGMELDSPAKQLNEQLACQLFGMLRQFQLSLQQRKETFSMNSGQSQSAKLQQQLFSPNSADDSGISADDCECCLYVSM